jgi:DeoR family fructose operon transcriptional repressor
MLAEERLSAILLEVATKRTVSVAWLCQLLVASESTVRRDIAYLAKQGLLKKVHGGASAFGNEYVQGEPAMSEKTSMNQAEKKKIGRSAAALIGQSDFIFIDAGTTTLNLAEAIGPCGSTFVTNGLSHARVLLGKGLKVLVLGGELKAVTESMVGVTALKALESFNFTMSFVGTNGIALEQGFTTPDPNEAAIKAKVLEKSSLPYILADSSKFGKITAVNFWPLDKATIITGHSPAQPFPEKAVVWIA